MEAIRILHFSKPKKPRKPLLESYDTEQVDPRMTLEDWKNVSAIVAWSVWAVCGIVATWIGCRAAIAAWIGA